MQELRTLLQKIWLRREGHILFSLRILPLDPISVFVWFPRILGNLVLLWERTESGIECHGTFGNIEGTADLASVGAFRGTFIKSNIYLQCYIHFWILQISPEERIMHTCICEVPPFAVQCLTISSSRKWIAHTRAFSVNSISLFDRADFHRSNICWSFGARNKETWISQIRTNDFRSSYCMYYVCSFMKIRTFSFEFE